MLHIVNDCRMNTSILQVVSQLYAPIPILPENGCAVFSSLHTLKKNWSFIKKLTFKWAPLSVAAGRRR